jgi:hypothetical protein
LSSCTGKVIASRSVSAGFASSQAGGFTLSGDSVFVVGNAKVGTQQDGLWARLSASDLSVNWTNLIVGSEESDNMWDVAVATDGSIWLGGGSGNGAGAGITWAAKGDPSGNLCDFVPFEGASGNIRALTATPSGVFIPAQSDGVGVVRHFDPAGCTACPCPFDWESKPLWDGLYTEPRDIEVVGSTMFVAGFEALADGDYQAFVARLQAFAPGEVVAKWTWDPSTLLDIPLDIASDGQTLFVAFATHVENDKTANGRVVALPNDFTSTTAPLWSVEPSAIRGVWGVAVDPSSSDGLYVAGDDGVKSWVARCTRSGTCP